MKTLLIIDMQQAWLARPGAPCLDLAGVTERINFAADRVRREGGQVVFIQHADEDAPRGSDAWQIVPALHIGAVDARVDKTACDSFGGTALAAMLRDNGTGTLYLCGFATEFCVDTTLRAAAARGMHVIALSDAHTTCDRPHLTAGAIVTHHNWIWTNMSCPSDATLTVQTTAQAFPA
jgi:nicotinamidase-related amidase